MISKKLFTLISTIIGAIGTIAIAFITYFSVKHGTAINTAIGIATTAIIDILTQFIDDKSKSFFKR